jgi:hypothetical protein
MDKVLFILAAIAFLLDALQIKAAVAWTPLGFCLLTLALFVL